MSLLTSRSSEGAARAELEASRARLVAAADEARRGLERNLHDGAQQRLVVASIWLQRAAAQTRGTSAAPLVDHALDLVQQGLADLRDLAHGLHPALLDQGGLAAALAALAARAPLPVELRVAPRRVPRPVEAAFYFTIAEALTNVFKHAHATRARVTLALDDDALIAEIVDDGIGGASVAAGSGLRGLTDRLDTVGGTLTVDSPRGGPTTIRACAPLRRLAISDASEDVSGADQHAAAAPS
jgi:signal transduction histidine kinase